MTPYVLLLTTSYLIHVSHGLPYPQGCGHAGQTHAHGQDVPVADPCVKCRCVRGSLVCRLRVCSPQPLPPPAGCLVLTRRAECCQRLLCSQDTDVDSNRPRLSDDVLENGSVPSGCVVNGSVYAEGSAMDSSTRCQYCYCIKGRQHCVRPQCRLLETDCVPVYDADTCCPVKYNCSKVENNSTTTTSRPSTGAGCEVEGRLYPEGELIQREGAACENCFCLMGRLHCEPVVCSVPVNKNCVPVLTTGHCCPTSYNCSAEGEGTPTTEMEQSSKITKQDSTDLHIPTPGMNHLHINSERSITGSTRNTTLRELTSLSTQSIYPDSTPMEDETSTTLDTTTVGKEDPTTLTESNDITETATEISALTEVDTTTTLTTLVTDINDTGARVNMREEETTTIKIEESTLIVNDSSTANATSLEINKSLPSEIEAILNKTQLSSKDDDYDYDYNDPSLPPSLPNLRIIPFVAADAVVEEPEPVYRPMEKSHPTKAPHFYDGSHPSGFSPPAETEGGFVPKEPLLDGPFYESKYNNGYPGPGSSSGDLTPITLASLPAITEPPKPLTEEKCVSGGRTYGHGELLTEPAACDLCMCFYGKILCQEPKCPVPEPGCRLLHEREHGTCCRKLVCNGNSIESPTRVVDNATPPPPPHLPPFTVADVVLTPDPFRDVIRTEPAPDLSSLIGEVIPFLWDQSTTTPVSLTTAEPIESSPVFINNNRPPPHTQDTVQTTVKPTSTVKDTYNHSTSVGKDSTVTSTTVPNHKSPPTTVSINLEKETNKTKVVDDYDYKDNKEEESGDEEFSFGSVFSYFFDSEKWTTTEKPIVNSPSFSQPHNNSHVDVSIANNTLVARLNNSVTGGQSLQHRSDEDFNELSNLQNSISEQDITESHETTTKVRNSLQNHKVLGSTGSDVTTSKVTETTMQHTTVRNILSKLSTKRNKYTSTYSRPRPTASSHLQSLSEPDPGAASGLLKLAGCNIYGRMYRVGRIISELSGPCLECMCTEVGVQCRPLKC